MSNNLIKKDIHIPGFKIAGSAIKRFSIGEKAIFFLFAIILSITSMMLVSKTSNMFSTVVPEYGGSLTEGIVGSPRFINPILAVSDADRDLSALIFSGLMKATTEGSLQMDLAEKYEISKDGLSYTVTIKNKAFFHDGKPITSDDIIFTIEKAKDPNIKSPRRAEWEGVTLEKINDKIIVFHLPRPYYPFIENLTLGIIPKHLWQETSPEEFAFSLKNISPIGSGPFYIESVEKNKNGIPIVYNLVSFSKYASQKPFIKKFIIKLFSNESDMENAWQNGEIENMSGLSPSLAQKLIKKGANVQKLKLPRVYGVFFNQNQSPIFTEKAVRQALDMVIEKENLVKKVLSGYGNPLYGPLPSDIIGQKNNVVSSSASTTVENIEKAKKILNKAGWKLNEASGIMEKTEKTKKGNSIKTLSFSLSIPNIEEMKKVAEELKNYWKAIGISAEIKVFEPSDLSLNVIRPRKYDALLFGQIIGRNPDLFAFWYSSQRNDPGYNIALYTNSKVDKLLDESRQVKTQKEQEAIMNKIFNEINNDIPAVFLYTPDYLYVIPNNIKGFNTGFIASPAERFSDINHWFIRSQKVWKNFVNKDSN